MIEVKNVKHSYKSKQVLKGINISIDKKETIGIMGRNGAGKSTLIDIIASIKKPTEGIVEYDFNKKEIHKKLGIQLQEAQFDGRLSIKDWCDFWSAMYGVPKQRVDELLKEFELEEHKNQKVGKLSGGQRQKLNIICAILHDPEIMIFDEITTGLDAPSRKDVRRKLKILRDTGRTILIVSHYMEELEELCDRFVILKDGYIVEDSDLDTLKKKYDVSNLEGCFEKIIDEDTVGGRE